MYTFDKMYLLVNCWLNSGDGDVDDNDDNGGSEQQLLFDMNIPIEIINSGVRVYFTDITLQISNRRIASYRITSHRIHITLRLQLLLLLDDWFVKICPDISILY